MRDAGCGVREGYGSLREPIFIVRSAHELWPSDELKERISDLGFRISGWIGLALRTNFFLVRSAHGLMARTCADKGSAQAVTLH